MNQPAGSCHHDLLDPFTRAWHFTFAGHQRFGAACYALYTCARCGSTLTMTLAEPSGEDWDDGTAVTDTTTPPLTNAEERAAEVRARVGFVEAA